MQTRSPHTALLSPKLGIEQPVVETWLRRVPYGVTPLTPQIVASQQQIADLFLQQKRIPKAVNVQGAVWEASFPVAGL
jgi:sulfonate transport system substrate-binding protein